MTPTFCSAVKIPINGRFAIPHGLIRASRSKVQVDGLVKRQANLTSFKPGENHHTRKAERIAAKLNELVAEYFPNGGYSVMDANRLKLAAAHYVDADLCRDPVIRQRATRCAEYLLSKLKPPPAPRPPAVADQAALALELLLNRSPDV